ncbi:Polyketide cyclase / dehydrase and lipid transport [Novymonas esmeraldas]|uniref:Polyketide cyclase / dehydrase and lipid transport n=1 Tax=Novymonas esmeraldas TaxID=1808958 RepID=A0AAW0F0Y7_9TRYP
MELSRLLHRHGGGSSAAPASASVAVGVAGGYHSDAAAAPPAPPPPQSHAAEGSSAVARAHAAIAAAALHRTGGTAGSSNAAGASAASASRAGTCATWSSNKSNGSGSRHHSQVYKEHCTIGWSPEEFYRVVADVEQYAVFLPWCAGSEVHTSRRVRVPLGPRRLTGDGGVSWSPAAPTAAGAEELVDAIETTATLTIGFSFLKEQYTSRVTLFPGRKIVAALYDDGDDGGGAATAASPSASTGSDISGSSSSGGGGGGLVFSFLKKAAYTAGAAARRSLLKHLLCEWEFLPVEGQPNAVEVLFSVSFEFKNPLHSHMIMANVVTLMTRSFERRCETLYGPPSATKVSLPLLS